LAKSRNSHESPSCPRYRASALTDNATVTTTFTRVKAMEKTLIVDNDQNVEMHDLIYD
jgi:hypothetical protein